MSRLALREMFFLTAPVALIAVVAFMASRRSRLPETPPHGPLLKFTTRAPTTLEAFAGTDAVFLLEYLPATNRKRTQTPTPTPTPLRGRDPYSLTNWEVIPALEVQTRVAGNASARKVTKVTIVPWQRRRETPWWEVWNGETNNDTFRMRLGVLPPDATLFFSAIAKSYGPLPGATSGVPVPPRLQGHWKVNRAALKPFDFAHLPRQPLVTLISLRIIEKKPYDLKGEALLRLDAPKATGSTPFDLDLSAHGNRVGGTGWSFRSDDAAPRMRRIQWSMSRYSNSTTRPADARARLTGRISVDNGWPLAFASQTFDISSIKVGHKLKFTAEPAPLPKTPLK